MHMRKSSRLALPPHRLAISSGANTISFPPTVPVLPLTPKVNAYPGGSSDPAGGSSRRGQEEALDFCRMISTYFHQLRRGSELTLVERMRKVLADEFMGPYRVTDLVTRLLAGRKRSRWSCGMSASRIPLGEGDCPVEESTSDLLGFKGDFRPLFICSVGRQHSLA